MTSFFVLFVPWLAGSLGLVLGLGRWSQAVARKAEQ